MIWPIIPVQKRTGFDQGWNRNNESCWLHVPKPFLMRQDCGVLTHRSPCDWPQIDESDWLNALRPHLVEASDSTWFGLHFAVDFRETLRPIAFVGFQLALLLFGKQFGLELLFPRHR